MSLSLNNKKLLGINGMGRIGKLLLWNQIGLKQFDGIVVNLGRDVGTKLDDLIQIVEYDSTYGSLSKFLYGFRGTKAEIKVIDAEIPVLEIDGLIVKFLRKSRNPKDINWLKEGVSIVVECTGAFPDPTVTTSSSKPCLRGHLESGALKVILSAPFKIKDSGQSTPQDATTMIYGINHSQYNAQKHHVISAASCTTTGLAHMMKPLLDTEETSQIITASMSTIHAMTNTQAILDSVPKAGSSDMRKNRSVFNNIIITTTGVTKALELVMPEIANIGFMADSVRIPTNTVSLINLNITFHSETDHNNEPKISREFINNLYKKASESSQKDLLVYADRQNVSSDLIGTMAACVIEGYETHTRTGFISVPKQTLNALGITNADNLKLPVTHAKLFGWYDNELGSYVYSISKLIKHIADNTPS
jgi:glyceraldehyde 3-phosphate dehydrogenase